MSDALDRAVEERLSHQPARLVHRGEHSAILVTGRPVNHVLHLLATVVTGGLWLIPWLVISGVGGERTVVLSLDDSGTVRMGRGRTRNTGEVRWVRVGAALAVAGGLMLSLFGRVGVVVGVVCVGLGVVAFVVDVWLHGTGRSVTRTERAA